MTTVRCIRTLPLKSPLFFGCQISGSGSGDGWRRTMLRFIGQLLLALLVVGLLGLSAGVMSLLRNDAEREVYEAVYGKKTKTADNVGEK